MKSVALALGSGGARGLAHIAVLEALDDLGVKPTAIAGASIGALSAPLTRPACAAKKSASTRSRSPTAAARSDAA